jgi:hypothetical protein
MQAAIWGMEHFAPYLRGHPFILYTDNQPQEELGHIQAQTLNQLQEAMPKFQLRIVYKKGYEMPTDYLSRNIIDAICYSGYALTSNANTRTSNH